MTVEVRRRIVFLRRGVTIPPLGNQFETSQIGTREFDEKRRTAETVGFTVSAVRQVLAPPLRQVVVELEVEPPASEEVHPAVQGRASDLQHRCGKPTVSLCLTQRASQLAVLSLLEP